MPDVQCDCRTFAVISHHYKHINLILLLSAVYVYMLMLLIEFVWSTAWSGHVRTTEKYH